MDRPWHVVAPLLGDDPWTSDLYCEWGTGAGPDTPAFGVGIRFDQQGIQVWGVCWCPAGMYWDHDDPITPGVDVTIEDGCYCANGSSNEGCDTGGSGDPGDPGDPGGGGGGSYPTGVDTIDVWLACDSVQRAEVGGCELKSSSQDVSFLDTGWSAELPDVGEVTKSGGDRWEGPIVLTTPVEADGTLLHPNLTVTDFSTTEAVVALSRDGWSWGDEEWEFDGDTLKQSGGAYLLNTYPFTIEQANDSIALGFWCANIPANCVEGESYMQPAAAQISSGYTLSQVPSGGPNAGLWYVLDWDFATHSGSAIHLHLEQTSPHLFTGMTSCDSLNWWGANACKQVATSDLQALRDGVEDHEAFGSNGDNGHESLARSFAEQFDPAKAIEGLFRATESELEAAVQFRVQETRDELDDAIDEEDEPTGNFSPKSIFLEGSGGVWTSYVFVEGGSEE